MPNNNSNQNIQDYSQIDAQKYYLEQFERWQKMSVDPVVEKEQPELWRELQKLDFEVEIKMILSNLDDYYEFGDLSILNSTLTINQYFNLVELDYFYNFIYIGVDFAQKMDSIRSTFITNIESFTPKFLSCDDIYLCKPILLEHISSMRFRNTNFDNISIECGELGDISLEGCYGSCKIIMNHINISGMNQETISFDWFTNSSIDKCKFDNLILENYNITYFNSKSKKYLLELHSEGKLELINCNFPELKALELEQDNLTLKSELESTKGNQPQEIFDLTDVIPREYWEPFTTYFSGFKSFVRQAKGRNIGIELNVNNYFLFKVFSDNQEDLAYAKNDLNDFLTAINYYSQNKYQSLDKLQSGNNVELAHMMMENRVNQLIQEIKYLELENRTLRETHTFVGIIQVLQDGIIQQLNSNQLLLTNHQPTIYTEGKIDVDYLVAAIRVLGFKKLESVKIESIGKEDSKGDNGGGQSSLDSYYKANRNKTDQFGAKIILLYDCDTKAINSNQDDKLYCYRIPLNQNNQKYPLGIENLLPESYFLDSKYWKTTIKESNGKRTTIEELDKIKLCQAICNQARLEDFESFRGLLSQLEIMIFD